MKSLRVTSGLCAMILAVLIAAVAARTGADLLPTPASFQMVLAEADCWLHLDVNNTYVNSVNFNYDPVAFLRGLF